MFVKEKSSRNVFSQYLRRYGAETMTLIEKSAQKLRVAQRPMEKAMLSISLYDPKRNTWISSNIKLRDVVEMSAEREWRWAGRIARMGSERWTRRLLK